MISRPRLRGPSAALILACTAACALAISVLGPGSALANTTSFTTAGCTTWAVPSGVSRVQIAAIGSAGQTVNAGVAVGGTGDVVTGTLFGLSSGEALDVCVNSGGGARGGAGNVAGGTGGGASGVALGSDFATPVLVAGGGGGGALDVTSGGNAGLPSGSSGSFGFPGGGTGGTQSMGGMGGTHGACGGLTNGGPGVAFTSAGPGTGGAGGTGPENGGGGGGGYYGGGGGGGDCFGGAGGGGGGSDLCASALTGASLSGCGVTGTNSTFGAASVVLTYAIAAPPSVSITVPANGVSYAQGQVVDSSFTCNDGAGGPGIATCVDQYARPSGAALDTSTTGLHTLTVTATSKDGLTGRQTLTYSVTTPGGVAAHGSIGALHFTLRASAACIAPGDKLAVTTTATGSNKRWRVVSYSFFIDRGRARDKHVTVNGKRKTVIVYVANLVTRRAGRQLLSVNGVGAGTHKLRLVILLRSAERKTKTLTLTIEFTVC